MEITNAQIENAKMQELSHSIIRVGFAAGFKRLSVHKGLVITTAILFLFIFQSTLSSIDNVSPIKRVMNGAISTTSIFLSR